MEKTTNISELPIQPNLPATNSSEIENKVQINPSNITMDANILNKEREKHVKFADVDNIPNEESINKLKNNLDDHKTISNEVKLISLASLLFFIFIDNKFKIYIINILTQIFGVFLKTETGGTSKIGNLFYSITFGLILYIFTRFIDFTALQF